MVFFNCNACGEALKKNQVDKHANRCRGCQVLSCVDCGKDFWGNDYQTHTKCMTENEKYCGKSYVPKVNKGEVKQEQWIEKVQIAIEKSVSNPTLRGLLESLKDYPNIPRKQQKFQNFLMNSLRVRNPGLIAKVWELLMIATDNNAADQRKHGEANQIQQNGNAKSDPNQSQQNGEMKSNSNQIQQNGESNSKSMNESESGYAKENVENEKKMSKRDKKEKRREKANRKEKKDKEVHVEEEVVPRKKSKKRKREEENNDLEIAEENIDIMNRKEKKLKQAENGDAATEADIENLNCLSRLQGENQQVDEAPIPKKKKKFRWEDVIIQVLQSKGEISLKKLRKKVLNEFESLGAANYGEENLRAKFEKKLTKMAQVKVSKDRVKLK